MLLGEKIQPLMELKGIKTLQELAQRVRDSGAPNVKYQHIQQLIAKPDLAPRYLLPLAKAFGMTAEQLAAWKPGKGVAEELPDVTPDDGEWADILGVRQAVALGDGIPIDEYAETHKLKFRASSLRRKRLSPGRLAVCYGRGDSMEPRIHDGDAILFDTGDREPQDGKLFVVFYDQKLMAKQLSNLDGIWYLESLNKLSREWRKPIRIETHKNIQIQGRVRWIGSWED